MSDIEKKRSYVDGLYSGKGWKEKVRKMSDKQVVAIYLRELSKAAKKSAPPPTPKKESNPDEELPF